MLHKRPEIIVQLRVTDIKPTKWRQLNTSNRLFYSQRHSITFEIECARITEVYFGELGLEQPTGTSALPVVLEKA